MAPKSVLITGCSAGGIGSALVEGFQRRGLSVFATARSSSKMSHLEKIPNVTLLTLDVTAPHTITAAVEMVKAKTGGTLDYLVNNCGISHIAPLLDMNVEEAKEIFDVNLWGVMAMTQAFAPLLIAASGSIVNISSISTYIYAPWMSVYGASKAALTFLSETLRLEMAPLGVKVVTVITGVVDTNITNNGKEVKLPPTSQYLSIEEKIAARGRGEHGQSKMTPEHFAEKVVGDVLAGASGKIWRGSLASTIRFISNYVPASFFEGVIQKDTGLDTFKRSK